ncbi:GIY-YIG nuclease family protein [Xanthomonas campestris pv. campestris]|nr:GIY-YIG nuclease family protein [Xanthomonas campestris pv. campestris]MEB2056355.1 GIY-YIG nuclease family protein [Xanthomonas campestris pv. campestris]
MTRALKRWWVYLAAVPLADGKSAFRVGRSSDMRATVKALNEDSPIQVSQISAISVGSNRFALAAEALLLRELASYRRHGNWVRVSTIAEADRKAVAAAMQAIAELVIPASGGHGAGWHTLKVSKPLR